MKCLLYCIFFAFFVIGCRRDYFDNKYLITDPKQYYLHLEERNRQMVQNIGTIKYPCIIYELGRNIVIIETADEHYHVIKYRHEVDTATSEKSVPLKGYKLTNDTILDKGNETINDILNNIPDSVFYYDVRFKSYSPGLINFCVFDSHGSIKMIADQSTLIPTQDYYKKKSGLILPISHELGQLIFDLIFEKYVPYKE